jgi:hypothetical protein
MRAPWLSRLSEPQDHIAIALAGVRAAHRRVRAAQSSGQVPYGRRGTGRCPLVNLRWLLPREPAFHPADGFLAESCGVDICLCLRNANCDSRGPFFVSDSPQIEFGGVPQCLWFFAYARESSRVPRMVQQESIGGLATPSPGDLLLSTPSSDRRARARRDFRKGAPSKPPFRQGRVSYCVRGRSEAADARSTAHAWMQLGNFPMGLRQPSRRFASASLHW